MEKKKKNGILRKLLFCVPILCVIAVVATFYMIFDMNKKIEDRNYNVDLENDYTDNESNEISNTNILENINQNNTENISSNDNSSSNSNEDTFSSNTPKEPTGDLTNSTDNKQIAIDLVKKSWGEDDTVLFDCYVNSNGEYIVTISSTSGKVISYYKVDLEKEYIELY